MGFQRKTLDLNPMEPTADQPSLATHRFHDAPSIRGTQPRQSSRRAKRPMNARIFAGVLLFSCAGHPPVPPQAIALNQLGAEALAVGDLETADARLSLATDYAPRFVEAWVNLGLVELSRGNLTRARKLLAHALRLNPHVAQTHHALGSLEAAAGNPERALSHFRAALAVHPGFVASRLACARLLFAAERYEEARIDLRKAQESAPNDPDVPAALFEVLLKLGREPEALDVAETAHQHAPNAAPIALIWGRTQLKRGEAQAALETLRPLTRLDAVAGEALAWMAVAEEALGRPRHAIGAAEQALTRAPQDPVAQSVLKRAQRDLNPRVSARRP